MWRDRRSVVALGLLLALVPLSAHAEDGNQAAIDKAKIEKAAMAALPFFEQPVVLGQQEIANARAIAQLLRYDGHAQTELPNSMQQYNQFCDAAIQRVQANLTNAAALVADRPWDPHAQAEFANADATMHQLWGMIGTTYPGNPYLQKQVRGPSQGALLGDDEMAVADDQAVVASDDEMAVAEDAPEAVAE